MTYNEKSGFPGSSAGNESTCSAGEPGCEDPLEKEMATHSSILAWKSNGWGSLVGYSPWGGKESDMTERLHFHFHFGHKQGEYLYSHFRNEKMGFA